MALNPNKAKEPLENLKRKIHIKNPALLPCKMALTVPR